MKRRQTIANRNSTRQSFQRTRRRNQIPKLLMGAETNHRKTRLQTIPGHVKPPLNQRIRPSQKRTRPNRQSNNHCACERLLLRLMLQSTHNGQNRRRHHHTPGAQLSRRPLGSHRFGFFAQNTKTQRGRRSSANSLSSGIAFIP
jgi:hypothetical protein